jgi:hypothetical protein
VKKDGYQISVLGIAIGLYALFSMFGMVRATESVALTETVTVTETATATE